MYRLTGPLIAAVVTLATLWAGPVHAQDTEARFEGCRAKLKMAQQLDLLRGMTFDGGRPTVTVGPTWYRIDFDAKTGLAETAACFFLAGKADKAITFPILDSRTGKQVARWKFTRLEVE